MRVLIAAAAALLLLGDPSAPPSRGILSDEPQRRKRVTWNERGRWIGQHLPPPPEQLTKRQRRRARGRAKQSRHPTRS